MNLSQAFGDRIQIADGAADWKEAVRMAVEPLVAEGFARECYIEAIYKNVERNGDYFILAPGFAFPHARPEEGGVKTGLSLLKLVNPVTFSSGEEVKVIAGFSAADSSEHIDMLSGLADILMEEESLERMFRAESVEELRRIFS